MSTAIIDAAILYQVYDSVPTTISTLTLPQNSSAVVDVRGVARRDGNGDTKSWFKSFTCKRETGDAVIMANPVNVTSPVGDLGALTWNLTVTADEDNVLVQVTGQDDATVSFYVKLLGLSIQD